MPLKITELQYSELEFLSEVEKLNVITDLAANFCLEPDDLLYTGIDGGDIRKSRKIIHPDETFGYTLDDWRRSADLIDRVSPSGTPDTPLEYAKDTYQPTLLMYDLGSLALTGGRALLHWKPIPNQTLEKAARLAVIILE